MQETRVEYYTFVSRIIQVMRRDKDRRYDLIKILVLKCFTTKAGKAGQTSGPADSATSPSFCSFYRRFLRVNGKNFAQQTPNGISVKQ